MGDKLKGSQEPCTKCGRPKEKGNETIWCKPCTDKERESHTLKLSEEPEC